MTIGSMTGHLITAAPELLAAVRAALDLADSWHEFHTGSDIVCDDLCAIRPRLRAAIAKAEGAANEQRFVQ